MLRRSVVTGLIFLAASVLAGTGATSPRRISLGELTLPYDATAAEQSSMRLAILEELATLELPARGERYVLSAALVRMDTRRDSDFTEIGCEVSTTLRTAGTGALHAIIKGRARVRDNPRAIASARRLAIGHAVRSAVRRVPDAIR